MAEKYFFQEQTRNEPKSMWCKSLWDGKWIILFYTDPWNEKKKFVCSKSMKTINAQ